MNRDTFIADLTRDEGLRLFVYDDATGLPIKPGSIVRGHPSIGIGRALDTHGITAAEAKFLLSDDDQDIEMSIAHALPWWSALDDARQRVLAEMAFEMGLVGLCGFRATLAACEAGNYTEAAAQMRASRWYTQVPARAERLAILMEQGDQMT